MTHPATNNDGWEIQEYDEERGWRNPLHNPDGTPKTYPTEAAANLELSCLFLMTSSASTKNLRVYEVLSPPAL